MAGDHPEEAASDAAFWREFRDGWGLVRGTVRLASGQTVDGCGVIYYPLGPPSDAINDILFRTDADGVYSYPLPAGTYTMAANGSVSRIGTAGGTAAVPVLGKVTGVTVSPRQIVTADITVMERPDLIDKTGDLAELLDIRYWHYPG
ncbi:MAG TPA: carboxypeptidase-like regulatory domain-containing protein [Streptosporangiaceae bacterium]|nr:carboxypeptidase-like regulatory domain-containing protein [Streptosporangiaceae bacterium]